MTRRWRRRGLALAAVLLIGVLIVGGSAARAAIVSAGRIYSADEAPARSVGLVLGAHVTDAGQPSNFLAARLEVALRLYVSGKVQALLVSGDGSPESRNEPRVMRDYLVARGVPSPRIVEDPYGLDTYDSCRRARDTYGVDEVTLISQGYHLARAIALCRGLGVDAIGAADETMRHAHPGAWYPNTLRELPANLKADWELLLQRAPLVSSPRSDELDRALESAG